MNLLLLLQLIGKKDNQFHEIFLLPLTIFINNALLFLSLNCFDSCSKLHHQYFLKEIKSMMHIKLYFFFDFLTLLFFFSLIIFLKSHGQSSSWLKRLIPVLLSNREEARNLAAFHFCMEAEIKKQQVKKCQYYYIIYLFIFK